MRVQPPARPPLERGFFGPSPLNYKVLASGTSVPTSFTSIYTAPERTTAVVESLIFYPSVTESGAIAVLVRLLKPDGSTVVLVWGAAITTTVTDRKQAIDQQTYLVVPPGWSLQIDSDGANSIHYAAFGREMWVP